MYTQTTTATCQCTIWPQADPLKGKVHLCLSIQAVCFAACQSLRSARPCRVQHLLSLLRITEEHKQSSQAKSDQSRVNIASWLNAQGKLLDVAAVNADLDTGIHCAVRSFSPWTMQVADYFTVVCLHIFWCRAMHTHFTNLNSQFLPMCAIHFLGTAICKCWLAWTSTSANMLLIMITAMHIA